MARFGNLGRSADVAAAAAYEAGFSPSSPPRRDSREAWTSAVNLRRRERCPGCWAMYLVQLCNSSKEDSASASSISVVTVGMVNTGSEPLVSMGAVCSPGTGVAEEAPWVGAPGAKGSAGGNVSPEKSPPRGDSRPEEADADGPGPPFAGGGLPDGVGGCCLFLPFLGGVVDMRSCVFAPVEAWENHQMVVVRSQEADGMATHRPHP